MPRGAPSTALSVRLPRDVYVRLAGEAKLQGVTVSALVTRLVDQGLGSKDLHFNGDGGALVRAVRELFAPWSGPGVDANREMALQAARIAEMGGASGVAAIRQLHQVVEGALGRDDPAVKALMERLATPV